MILCSIHDIAEEQAKGFILPNTEQVFAVKKDGRISMYENRCPHLGIPLEMMPDQFLDLEKNFIQCSTHGALFNIDNGFCVAGPCKGASLQKQAFEVIDGLIHVQVFLDKPC